MKRRTAGVVAVTAALIATILAVVLTRSAGAGPFAHAGGGGAGLPVKIGQFGVTGLPMPRTLKTETVLLDMRPLHPEDAKGLTIRYLGTTGHGLELAGARGWHPKAWEARPLAGFVIPAHVRGGVMMGAASEQPGVYRIRDFVLDYRIGGTHYSARMGESLTLCVGPRWWPVKAGHEVRSCL
jgi:hypothetical protein